MATPPGTPGYTLVGDKSVEFYRDTIGFVDRRITQHNSRVFLTRLLNKPTVCVASNNGVRQVLCDQSHHIEPGYKSLMQPVYGDNVLFYEADEAQQLRSILHTLFSPDTIATFQVTIDSLTKRSMDELQKGDPASVYSFFKQLTTAICLSVFLDVDFQTSEQLANDIVTLTTLHWHGIISVPMSFKMPLMQTSSFGKALEAKKRLLEIIDDKLSKGSSGFPRQVAEANFPSRSVASGNLLLFTSALVPKALASIFTSFILALGRDEALQERTRQNDQLLACVLLEVQRMWPPFVGGRRLVKQDCSVEGYHVPAGHAIVYLTQHAQRDPAIFEDPDKFTPARWLDKNKYDKDKLFLYGAGPRCCIGRELVKRILKTMTTTLLQTYRWSIPPDSEALKYKWLPVLRPKDGAKIHFTLISDETNTATDDTVPAVTADTTPAVTPDTAMPAVTDETAMPAVTGDSTPAGTTESIAAMSDSTHATSDVLRTTTNNKAATAENIADANHSNTETIKNIQVSLDGNPPAASDAAIRNDAEKHPTTN